MPLSYDAYDDDDMPLPLVSKRSSGAPPGLRQARRRAAEIEAEDDTALRRDYRTAWSRDRMAPGTAGALMGFLAGAAGLGVVHAMHLPTIAQGIARISEKYGIPTDASIPLTYLSAGIGGALIGALFASVTQHLRRRYIALLAWALIFFVSLTTLVLAISAAYGRGIGVWMAPSIILASVAYAFVWSLQLPLRRRT